MKISSAFPSTYLKAADLNGEPVTVTISHVKIEEIADGEHKPVIYFTKAQKGLVLNKTNANAITDILKSDDTDDWEGHRIVLYPTRVDFQGKRVDAIRVDAAKPKAKPQPEPEPDDFPADDEEDAPRKPAAKPKKRVPDVELPESDDDIPFGG